MISLTISQLNIIIQEFKTFPQKSVLYSSKTETDQIITYGWYDTDQKSQKSIVTYQSEFELVGMQSE